MNIIITGANGFIGNNLLKFLIKKKYNVKGYDIINQQKDIIQINSTEELISSKIIRDTDILINCSGSSDVASSYSDPLYDFEKNSLDVFKILNCVKTLNPELKYINISSGAVYGGIYSKKINEDSLLKPQSIYGFNKLISEIISEEFNSIYNISTLSLRIFSAYGPGLKKQLFWDLYKKSKDKNRIDLYGSGDEFRDFIYIDDICHAIELLFYKEFKEHTIFNISSGKKTLIKDAVKIFFNLLDRKIEYNFTGSNLIGYPKGTLGDNNKIKTLGFRQEFSIKDGLERTVKWMLKQKL